MILFSFFLFLVEVVEAMKAMKARKKGNREVVDKKRWKKKPSKTEREQVIENLQ